jgi:hypothetical protein
VQNRSMAASNSSTLRCMPRLIGFSVSNAKKHQHHRLAGKAREDSGG